MPEYVEVLTDEQAAVAMAACELQADALTEVLACDGWNPDATVGAQRELRTLKTVVATTSQDREMWLDESNVIPVCEAIWNVDMFKADCAGNPFHTYVAEKIRELGLFEMAESHRPTI